jgi:hypothetical protein
VGIKTDNQYDNLGAPRPFYRIVLKLKIYAKSYILVAEPDSNNMAYFNLSAFLKPKVSTRFTYPEDASLISLQSNACAEYSFEYYDSYNIIAVTSTPKISNIYYALPGGISDELYDRLLTQKSNIHTVLKANKQFFTWQPYQREVTKDEIIKLYFCNLNPVKETTNIDGDAMNLNLYIDVHYWDGQIVTMPKYATTISLLPKLYEIQCSYNWLNIDAIRPNHSVRAYEVYLKNNTSEVSERRIFVLDNKHYHFQRQFIVRNSFGVYDCFSTKGLMNVSSEFERQLASRSINFLNRNFQPNQSIESELFEVNSGWYAQIWIDYFREMFLSAELYTINSNILRAIIAKSSKAIIKHDSSALYSMNIECQYTFNSNFYSKIQEKYALAPIEIEPEEVVWVCPPTVAVKSGTVVTNNIQQGAPLTFDVTLGRSDTGSQYAQQQVYVNLIIGGSNKSGFPYTFPIVFGEVATETRIKSNTQTFAMQGNNTQTLSFEFLTGSLPLGPIRYEVISDACSPVTGVITLENATKSRTEITFVEIVEGSTVQFNLNSKQVILTSSPVSNPNTFNSADDFLAQVNIQLAALGCANLYTVTKTNNTVIIEANQLGSQYNFATKIKNSAKNILTQNINAIPATGKGVFNQAITVLTDNSWIVVAFGPGGGQNRVSLIKNGTVVAQSNCNRFLTDNVTSSNCGYPTAGTFDTAAFNPVQSDIYYYTNPAYVGGNYLVGSATPKFVAPHRFDEMIAETEVNALKLWCDVNGNQLFNPVQYYCGQYLWCKANIADTLVLENVESMYYSGIAVAVMQLAGAESLITFTETNV